MSCVSLVLGSAAQAQEPKQIGQTLAERNQRIVEELRYMTAPIIHGWQDVDEQNVVLEDTNSRLLLVRLNKPCEALNSATSITMGRQGKEVHINDSIQVYRDKKTGGKIKGSYCQISAMYRLERVGVGTGGQK